MYSCYLTLVYSWRERYETINIYIIYVYIYENYSSPINVSLIFHLFPKPIPEKVFKKSACRFCFSWLTCSMPSSMFHISKKTPLGNLSCPKDGNKYYT